MDAELIRSRLFELGTASSALPITRATGRENTSLSPTEAKQRFYSLMWPHAAMVLRAARYSVQNAAEADDLAQETMIKAFRKIGRFDEGTNPRAWLLTILRNTRIDRLRASRSDLKQASLTDIAIDPAGTNSHVPEHDQSYLENPEEMLQRFSDEHVIKAFRKLPEEIRWTLLLVDVEGLDHDDAARVMDIPTGTVKSRAFRGRAMLRSELLPFARQLRLVE